MDEFFSCRLEKIEQLSDSVRSYRFSYPLSDDFLPGQFVMLDLPIDAEFSTRSYSIASAPNKEGWIELCIVLKPGGSGTEYLFDHVKEGDQVRISKPQGKFVLDHGQTGPVCMICTGTGVAPFRSMIQNIREGSGNLARPLYLFFGNRYENDILYRKEWEELEKKDANFHFVPVLSREENWKGARGYVHEHYLPYAVQDASFCFYLCGWSDMVREAKNKLKELGFSRKQLKFELYD